MAKIKEEKKKERSGITGTYVYDKELGRVIQISEHIPKVASKGKGFAAEVGPCGRSACGGGRCQRGGD